MLVGTSAWFRARLAQVRLIREELLRLSGSPPERRELLKLADRTAYSLWLSLCEAEERERLGIQLEVFYLPPLPPQLLAETPPAYAGVDYYRTWYGIEEGEPWLR